MIAGVSEPDRIERIRATSRALVAELDEVTTRAEEVMASLRTLQAWILDVSLEISRSERDPTSPDVIESEVTAALGLDDVDAARRRVIAALSDPMDDVPRPD